jgi:hypothetical protein
MSGNVVKHALEGFIGLIMITVGLIIFPVVITGAESIRLATNVSNYTGLTQVNGVLPLVLLVLWFFVGALGIFLGGKGMYQDISNR